MLNKTILIGRLTKDPELRHTTSGTPTTSFILAVDRTFKNKDGEKEADFIPIVTWRKQAELVAQYLTKGSLVAVEGRIQTRNYDDKDGVRKYVTEVISDNVRFLDNKKKQDSSASPGSIEDTFDAEEIDFGFDEEQPF